MKILLVFILVFMTMTHAFSQGPDMLLNSLVAKLNLVNDYSASVSIKADIPLIKILPVKAKVYFKKDDKFKVVSKGIAILPRQGFTDMNLFLSKPDSYMVVLAGKKLIGTVQTQQLTVIANESDSEIILIKLWVDPVKELIMQSEITTRSSGNVKVSYTYSGQEKYGLPSGIKFEVDVKEFKIPKSFSANPHKKSSGGKVKKRKQGVIYLTLSAYKVNQGIADSFFVK